MLDAVTELRGRDTSRRPQLSRLLCAPGAEPLHPPPLIVHRIQGTHRRVTARGRPVGVAADREDLLQLLGATGMEDVEEAAPGDVLVEWRGGGPEVWSGRLPHHPPLPAPETQHQDLGAAWVPGPHSVAEWDAQPVPEWDEEPFGPQATHVSGEAHRLGSGELAERNPAVDERGCWQCQAPVGTPCRKIAAARRFGGAHATRHATVTEEEAQRNATAVTVPCPHCEALPRRMCRQSSQKASSRIKLRKVVHSARWNAATGIADDVMP